MDSSAVNQKTRDSKILRCDVIVIGGGMVGLSLAIGLAQRGVCVAVVDKDDLKAQLSPAFDGRVSAISLGSERVLTHLGVFTKMKEHAQPIYDIRVVDQDTHAFMHFHYREGGGGEPMGHMIENRYIRSALLAKAAETPGLHLWSNTQASDVARDAYGVSAVLSDGTRVQAALMVAADGKMSAMRAQAGIGTLEADYGQDAIVCTIRHSLPHEGVALERFLPAGPFASLPMQDSCSAIVWTEPNAYASDMITLPEAVFVSELRKRLGDWLGDIEVIGKRFRYPLKLILAKRYCDTRFALIGDAAHAIHPIAGQGVNVGFRDVAVLVELLSDAHALGLDIGSESLLARYQRWRRMDAMSMGAITDGINRLFSNHSGALKLVRDTGLVTLNKIPPLKQFFMRHAMGLTGVLPKMMRAA